jgi:hypothetical protein
MAGRHTTGAPDLQQKVKVLQKLFDAGCQSEKQLQALSMESILKIDGITIADMTVILELQKRVRNHTLYSYLGGNENEPVEQNQ